MIFRLCIAALRSSKCISIEGWGLDFYCTAASPWFFSCHSFGGLQVCFRSLSFCMTQLQPSFSCQTAFSLTFLNKISWMKRSSPGAQVLCLQNKPRSSLVHHCVSQLVWGCTLWPKISSLLSSVQRALFKNYWCLIRCNFASLSCAALFREKRLSPGNPSKQALLIRSLSNCTKWGLWSLRCSSWVFL